MSRFVVGATWDDAPHLTAEAKQALWASIPPYQRDARTKGIPQLGAGKIYPVSEVDITVQPFEIPKHWVRGYGLDVGWNRTAGIFGAHDRDTGITYLYSEHYQSEERPIVHASAIKGRGEWIPGRIDPAARGRNQEDGKRLMESYQKEGLRLEMAENAVETGIYEVWTLLSTGKLKVFANLSNWFAEYRLYRRNKKGRVVKKNDHVMDASRYLLVSGTSWWKAQPPPKSTGRPQMPGGGHGLGWAG
jgi:hypothetical protein